MKCYFLILNINIFFQMEMETAQFLQEHNERIRLLHEKQARELNHFDEESARLGFRFVFYSIFFLLG